VSFQPNLGWARIATFVACFCGSNDNIDDDDGLLPATPHWRVRCGEESFHVDGTMWPRVEQPPLPYGKEDTHHRLQIE
jgi:hypothetical protein